jgi:hypothetical protein
MVVAVSSLSFTEDWILTFIEESPYGNWSLIQKPVSPVRINSTQIPVGGNWTYVYQLEANHTYHVYCYGDWINNGSTPATDYDIFLFDPLGDQVGYHTEAAGLPEHLGTSVDQPFFTPRFSGNYSFLVVNDARESQASDAATLMVIEHIETNSWHTCYIEGKTGNISVLRTGWAYEFMANSENIEIQTKVPSTLDMYEVRLYAMANPSSNTGELLNGVPLAWEEGLYGLADQLFGGYNLDSKGFRGNAFASCEYFGQDMLINYSAPTSGASLYHLAFIGEAGFGNVSFRVKTNFGDSLMELAQPIQRVYPDHETVITSVSSNSSVHNASLHYTIDNWNTSSVLDMLANDRICNGTIPGQEAGVKVNYRIEAFDFLDNLIALNGSYHVKHPSNISFTLSGETITIGNNITITGSISPNLTAGDTQVEMIFTSQNGSKLELYTALQNSSFSANFRPPFLGTWSVQLHFVEDELRHEASTNVTRFGVIEPTFFVKYSTFIYAGFACIVVAAIITVILRRRQ